MRYGTAQTMPMPRKRATTAKITNRLWKILLISSPAHQLFHSVWVSVKVCALRQALCAMRYAFCALRFAVNPETPDLFPFLCKSVQSVDAMFYFATKKG